MREFEFIGKSVFLRKEKILAIADLHLGFEQALAESGVLLPRGEYKEIINELKIILEQTGKLKEIIILGDLKHEFGTISGQEWKEVTGLLDFLAENCEKIVLVKGNHDTILEPIANKNGLEVKDFYIKGSDCFIHGHKIFDGCLGNDVKRIFIGHKHPAIIIRKGAKQETYKCFLAGKWQGREIVVLPSFFPLTEGSDVFIEETGLALHLNLKEFRVYAVGDKVYDLGKARDVGRIA